MHKYFLVFVLFFCFAGCFTGKLATTSGKPEIQIQSIDKKKVLDGIAAWSGMKGQSILSSNDYGLITEGDKNVGIFGMAIPVKTIFNVISNKQNVVIYASQTIKVENQSYEKGEGFNNYDWKTIGEKEKQLESQDDYERMQKELKDLRDFILTQ